MHNWQICGRRGAKRPESKGGETTPGDCSLAALLAGCSRAEIDYTLDRPHIEIIVLRAARGLRSITLLPADIPTVYRCGLLAG